MSEPKTKIDVAAWVDRAKANPVSHLRRQAIEIVLNAIAMVSKDLYLKGGILMGLVHNSPRLTMDIDLTSTLAPSANTGSEIREAFDAALPRAAASLGYNDLVLKSSSVEILPRKDNFETAQFPALKLRIGYAKHEGRQAQAVLQGNPFDIVAIDISFKEPTMNTQVLQLARGGSLSAYDIADLIAEKYRAILQQVVRKRNRRQDVFDICLLINNQTIDIDGKLQAEILAALLAKSRARDIEPKRDSLDNPKIKERSGADWKSIELEVGRIPSFDACFSQVQKFYKSLPWDAV